jgi:hypothetical protein
MNLLELFVTLHAAFPALNLLRRAVLWKPLSLLDRYSIKSKAR